MSKENKFAEPVRLALQHARARRIEVDKQIDEQRTAVLVEWMVDMGFDRPETDTDWTALAFELNRESSGPRAEIAAAAIARAKWEIQARRFREPGDGAESRDPEDLAPKLLQCMSDGNRWTAKQLAKILEYSLGHVQRELLKLVRAGRLEHSKTEYRKL